MDLLYSIIIPTYNRASFIEKTIASALNQSYKNLEVIVVDDGSTDNTEEIVKKNKSPKLFYYRKENAERGAARNFGVKKSSGDYVTFLDSDDLLFENHLSVGNHHIKRLYQPEVLFLNNIITNTEGKIIRDKKTITGRLNDKIFYGNTFGSMGIFIRKDVADTYPFIEDRRLAGTEDWELWLRLASRYHLHYSDEATCALINHEERSVLNASENQLRERTQMLIQGLSGDEIFMKKYGSRINGVQGRMLSYTALHLAMDRKPLTALKYLCRSLLINPAEIFQKRTLATIKFCLTRR